MGVVTVSCLGSFGRFGNSLFQYAFARAYAELNGFELLIPPDWIGRKIFKNVNEKPGLPPEKWEKTEKPCGQSEIDLYGYFQTPEHVQILSKKKLQHWFEPADHMKRAGFNKAFHKRRGDFLHNGNYAIVSDDSYNLAAEEYGYDPSKFHVFSDATSGEENTYVDFFEMVASRVLFRANSSYSFWAGALSNGKVFSPVVKDKTGWLDCEFVRGNHSQLMYLFGDLHIQE